VSPRSALKDQEFHAFGFGHFDDSIDAVVDDGFNTVRSRWIYR
jgi:cytochrome c peroxidase